MTQPATEQGADFFMLGAQATRTLQEAEEARRELRDALEQLIHRWVTLTRRNHTLRASADVFLTRRASPMDPAKWRSRRQGELTEMNLYNNGEECYPTFEAMITGVDIEDTEIGLKGAIVFAVEGDHNEYKCWAENVRIDPV